MRLYVAVTDSDWFAQHAARRAVDEVNFWRPSPDASFKALETGEILLFKLKSPNNAIAGGGFFTRFLHLPINMAWDTFRDANGVASLAEFRDRIAGIRNVALPPADNPTVGCIMLGEPFFWERGDWIPTPPEFNRSTQVGKTFNAEEPAGRALWDAVSARLQRHLSAVKKPATEAAIESKGFGKPLVVLPRLGQGLFRVIVTEAYTRRCAITGERTLPVLEAAHIKPYSLVQRHEVSNGLLLRSDLHKLFDEGYITVDPKDRRVLVSGKIREEFENGREYYRFHGQPLREPTDQWARASGESLEYHATSVFK